MADPDLPGDCFVGYQQESGDSNDIFCESDCSVNDTPDLIEDFRSSATSEQDEDDYRRVPEVDETTDDIRAAAMPAKGDLREAAADGGDTTDFRAEAMAEQDEDDYRKVVMRDKRASDLIASAGLVRGRGNFRAVSSTGAADEDFRSNAMAIRETGDWRIISPETSDVTSDWSERVKSVHDEGDEEAQFRAGKEDTLALHDLEAFKSEKWKTYMLGPYKAALETVFGIETQKAVKMKFQKSKETMIANDEDAGALATERRCYDLASGGEKRDSFGGLATTRDDGFGGLATTRDNVRISPPVAFKNDVCRPVDWTEDDAKLLKILSGRVLTQTEL